MYRERVIHIQRCGVYYALTGRCADIREDGFKKQTDQLHPIPIVDAKCVYVLPHRELNR